MADFAKALLILLPSFFLMIIIEMIYAKVKGRFNFRSMDVISSLSSGMTNAIKSILGLTIVILGYKWLHSHLALFEHEKSILLFFSAFVTLDFATYWYCLLYTSPSPRDRTRSRMPSSA